MFKKSVTGKISLTLEDAECQVLENLCGQLIELLETDQVQVSDDPLEQLFNLEGPTEIPSDTALARLFPDAFIGDSEAASEFRRFTEPELRRAKIGNARAVRDALNNLPGKQLISSDDAQAWLLVLNDLRLVLGTRLRIDDNGDYRKGEHDPATAYQIHVYDYLTYLQGTLVEAL